MDTKITPNDKGKTRVQKKKLEIQKLEKEYPLQTIIIYKLGEKSLSAGELAKNLNLSLEKIKKELEQLEYKKIVHKKRSAAGSKTYYRLTIAGQFRLSDHRAFGKGQKAPPPPSDKEAEAFISSALKLAIKERETGEFKSSEKRLRRIVSEAQKRNLENIEVDIIIELLITLKNMGELNNKSDLEKIFKGLL